MKKYTDILTQECEANHRPLEMALSDFLDFLIEYFSVEPFYGSREDYHNHVRKMADEHPGYTGLAFIWLDDVATAMERGKWRDIFGELYEEMYLSRGKASSTGQFFTPHSVSDLMSRLVCNTAMNGKNRVNDCACGSGRLLLSNFMEITKNDHSAGRDYFYEGTDKDIMSCKMCALNVMVHGMHGRVVCRDTLLMDKPSVIYHINEIRYPIPTPFYSIRTEIPQ